MMSEKICEFWRKAVSLMERRRKEVNSSIPLIVQTKRVREVVSKLRRRNLRVKSVIDDYIFVEVPDWATAEEIARWKEVEYITVEKFFIPYAVGIDELIKRISISLHPILSQLSLYDLHRLGIKVRPAAEIPNPIRAMIENILSLPDILKDPKRLVKMMRGVPPVVARADWQLVTFTRKLLGVPRDNRLSARTLVGAIDSECTYHPAFRKDFEYIMLNEPLTMAHGQWVSTCAFGDPCPTRYGLFYPVASCAEKAYTFVKVFGAFGGCSSEQVMKAMEICAKRGVRVVNMSLGGPLTDAVDKEPECVLLDKLSRRYGTIFVVAAGNEDGEFEIGSPGAALSALTVAAADWKNTYETSSYSSRGWQGIYYREHKDVFEKHLEKWGDIFLKPDCAGIGGDRDSQIVAGACPWYDGIMDFIPDGFEPMIGTCVPGDTLVELERGKLAIRALEPGTRVWSHLGFTDVAAVWNQGKAEIYTLTLDWGETIVLTPEHKVLTKRGWIPAENLTKDDYVATLSRRHKALMLSNRKRAEKIYKEMLEPLRIDPVWLGYIAGMIDGEGHLHFEQKKRAKVIGKDSDYSIQLYIHNTNLRALSKIQELLGFGGIYTRRKKNYNIPLKSEPKPSRAFKVSARADIYRLLKAVLPYLIIKRGGARKIVRMIENEILRQLRGQPATFVWRKFKSLEPAGREEVYDITTISHSFVASSVLNKNPIVLHNSMATPHVAGIVALAIDRGIAPPNVRAVKDMIRKTVTEELARGEEKMMRKTKEQGWGIFHWLRLKWWKL